MPIDPLNHNPASGIFTTKPPRKRRAKTYNPINPAVTPSTSDESLFKGRVETYAEKDQKRWFLEDLYGRQDEGLPRANRDRH